MNGLFPNAIKYIMDMNGKKTIYLPVPYDKITLNEMQKTTGKNKIVLSKLWH